VRTRREAVGWRREVRLAVTDLSRADARLAARLIGVVEADATRRIVEHLDDESGLL
jgi:hypothetical protein